jgi:hypothetical protein
VRATHTSHSHNAPEREPGLHVQRHGGRGVLRHPRGVVVEVQQRLRGAAAHLQQPQAGGAFVLSRGASRVSLALRPPPARY